MSTPAAPGSPILDRLATLRAAWAAPEWAWDARLDCASSSFPVALAPAVRTAVGAVFPAEWTSDTIETAPDHVAALARRCGGLRPGQLLLSGDAVAGMLPFALWWPWGDGSKVSVRLGIAAPDRPPGLTAALRGLFGVG